MIPTCSSSLSILDMLFITSDLVTGLFQEVVQGSVPYSWLFKSFKVLVNHQVQKGYGPWHCCKIMSRSNRLIPFILQCTVAPSFASHLLLHYNIYFFLLWHALGYSVIIAFNRGIINNSTAITQQLLIGWCVFNIVKNNQNYDFVQV